jgi:hypothetical protein
MYLKRMNEDLKQIFDAASLTFLSILGIDKFAASVNIISAPTTWREIAMDYILFASAVCTFIWLFFRAMDTVMEKFRQAQGWYQRRCKR